MFNLWHAVDAASQQATLDARRQADFTAAGLRTAFQDPRFLELLPAAARFETAGEEVRIPDDVGWLTPPARVKRDDLDPLIQSKLGGIEAGAVGGESEQTLRTLLDTPGLPVAHRDWLLAYVGFWAFRHGRPAWCETLLRELDRRRGGGVPGAACLLRATVHGRLADWADQVVPALPETLARPLLTRLRELSRVSSQGAELHDQIEKLVAAHDRVRQHRATLVEAAARWPSIAAMRSPVVLGEGDRLWLYRQEPGGRGFGALVSRPELRAALARLADEPWNGLPAGSFEMAGAPQPGVAHGVTVVPDFLVVRPRAIVSSGLAGAWIPAVVVLALVAITLTGLLFFYRSTRRETEAARARSEFLTMVTHELKTPLAGIRLLAEMLQAGHVATGPKREEYYTRLKNESERLTMLIENVLDLGRMERGERVFTFAPLDLRDVLVDAIEVFQPIAQSAGLDVELDLGSEPLAIAGDRHALLQAFLNVLDNARKYAASGKRVTVTLSRAGDTGAVRIRDRGPGIPAGQRTAIFERFQRGAEHASGSVPGVGLGLHLSRAILSQHGGSLTAEAPLDGGPGVCFTFLLSIRTPPPGFTSPPTPAHHKELPAS